MADLMDALTRLDTHVSALNSGLLSRSQRRAHCRCAARIASTVAADLGIELIVNHARPGQLTLDFAA